MISSGWGRLPVEMKVTVIEFLDTNCIKALSAVNKDTRALCIRPLFKSVNVPCLTAIRICISTVPTSYITHTQRLDVCTRRTRPWMRGETKNKHRIEVAEDLSNILAHFPNIKTLVLCLEGSPDRRVISAFTALHSVRTLGIKNCGAPFRTTLSERLVVSLAASVPNLAVLSIGRITRSLYHRNSLHLVHPPCPFVYDNWVPEHLVLGTELRLPCLLRLPSLRFLRVAKTMVWNEWDEVGITLPAGRLRWMKIALKLDKGTGRWQQGGWD